MSLLFRLCSVLVGIAASALLVEAFLRFAVPYRFIYRFPEVVVESAAELSETQRVPAPLLGDAWMFTETPECFTLRPEMEARFLSSEFDTALVTDGLGSRVGPLADGAGPNVLGVGDSFAQGFGVEAEETYLVQLGLRMREAHPGIRIVNGGVMGYAPGNSLWRLRRLLPMVRPDVVVFEIWVGNNLCASPFARCVRRAPRSLLGRASRAATSLHSARLLTDRLRANDGTRRWLMEKGILRRHAFEEILVEDFTGRCATPLQHLTTILRRARRASRAQGAKMIVLLLPLREQVDPEILARSAAYNFTPSLADIDLNGPNAAVRDIADQLQVPFVDATDRLRATTGAFFSGYDTHLTAAGHAAVAEVLRPAVTAALADE